MSMRSRVVVAVLCITAGLCLPQLAAAADQVIFHADFDADAPFVPPNPNPPGPPAGVSIVIYPLDNTVMVVPPSWSSLFTTNSLNLIAIAGGGIAPYFRGIPDPALGPFNSGQYVVTWSSAAGNGAERTGFATVVNDLGVPAFTVDYAYVGVDPVPTFLYWDGSGVQPTGVGYMPGIP